MSHYQPSSIEPKWQKAWEEKKAFKTPEDLATLKTKQKYYILDMFPYPSGAGLHVGHPEGYTATDVVARMKRMQGFWVLHPMGWDAFGLPAERAAMRENIHPAIITKRNVDNFRRQIKRLGFSYDWDREISTTDPEYYKWTQWIFKKLYDKNLAYLAEVAVNWCPAQGTVLANEEVKDGKYVETGDPVERRLMKQWMLKITAYAERLEKDLDLVDWPEGVKQMQREWIGKSLGAEIDFGIDGSSEKFSVFTTRPDTLFGVTYCVLAAEHGLVDKITTAEQKATVSAFVHEMKQTPDLQRTDLAKDKRGVFTGAYAKHPVTGRRIPVWIANYVLMSYGTGAVMAVPGHDERDHEFAKKYKLPILEVIQGGTKSIEEAAHCEDGPAINSEFLNGLVGEEARKKMTSWLEEEGKGKSRTTYRLRDWLFSRQRYWGEPFPVAHFESDGSVGLIPDKDLPVVLPPVEEYKPTEDGQPPLARADKSWSHIQLDGKPAVREMNTMPQWAGSCWYYLRYIDPKNSKQSWNPELEKYWLPVDLYIGGVEHAVLHLLYARFWHKVLYDCGLVTTPEPFQKLFNQGMILGISHRDKRGKYYGYQDVEEKDGKSFLKTTGEELESQIEKMAKSKLNVINPDEVVDKYGADALRLYELFMGPLEQTKPWKMDGVEGVYRFLARAWRLVVDEKTGNLSSKISDEPGTSEPSLWKALHKTVKKVSEDTAGLAFNTAISQMMIFTNEATNTAKLPKETLLAFTRILAPYAPHLAEELWEKLGQTGFVSLAPWPKHDDALTVDDQVTVVVQINGKLRDRIEVPKGTAQDKLQALALASPKVVSALEGKTPKRVVVIPDRLVNIVM